MAADSKMVATDAPEGDDDDELEDEEDDMPDNESITNKRILNSKDTDSHDDKDVTEKTTGNLTPAGSAGTAVTVICDENNVSEVSKDDEDIEYKDDDVEAMDVDELHPDEDIGSDVECLEENITDVHMNSENESEQHLDPEIDDLEADDDIDNKNLSGSSDVQALNDSVISVSSVDTSDVKICDENGSLGSPDIEEITETKSNGHNTSEERSPSQPKQKKPRKQIDLSNITPRRSSRNIKRTSYIEKEPEEEPEPDGSSDIEEIKPEDPLACVDGKDKENSKLKSPIKASKTTIVVSDTKRLVEIAAGSKTSKGSKKEPTLVIIDTNSILSGRGGIPVSSNKSSHHSITSSSAFSVLPVGMGGTQTIYPNMRTTITPVPMTSKTAHNPRISSSITAVPTSSPAPQILPTLTDDMFVVEAPSFIVPYVYEKPPLKPLKEFVTKLEKSIEERDKLDKLLKKEDAKKKGEAQIKDDTSESGKDDSEGEEEIIKNLKKDNEVGDNSEKSKVDDKHEEKTKATTYFDLPLGKFFMQIGVNLVQEFVQTDLLRTQKRKQGKGSTSAETQLAINSLIKNLEFSKENNEPFHLEMKKCEFCSFKTESALVMQHHLETPHMRNYVYKCNFCPLEVRSPHDILFHMEAEHNTRGRLERGPAFHQCPNCPFEDNQKGKLTRHILACAKKFRPERNLEPATDWEPPAKIPRLNRARHVGPMGSNALAMAMAAKGTQPLLPKLLPATMAGRGRGRPPMQPRYSDLKSLRPGGTTVRQGLCVFFFFYYNIILIKYFLSN